MKYGFGVDLGGTTVKIAYFDETGAMLSKWEIPTDLREQGKNILPDIAAALLGYIKENSIPMESLLGIGIGVPGPVSPEGIVPVRAGNDATVAALGECWKGGGQGCKNMIMATLGTGVGGGIVVNGQILLGAHGAAGEIGHIVLNRDETEPCNCGKLGCAEQYCSATGVVRVTKRTLAATDAPSALRQIENLTCKDVFDCAKAGDAVAQQALEKVYAYLGEFLANLCCTTNPERIVLGGGVSKAGQVLLDGIRPYFDKFVFHANRDVEFTLAVLGNDAGAYGAFKLILDAVG